MLEYWNLMVLVPYPLYAFLWGIIIIYSSYKFAGYLDERERKKNEKRKKNNQSKARRRSI